jgi:hypothetical protein
MHIYIIQSIGYMNISDEFHGTFVEAKVARRWSAESALVAFRRLPACPSGKKGQVGDPAW